VRPNLQQVKNVVDQVRGLPAQPDDGQSLRPPSGVTVYPSGLAVVGVGLLENLESNRVLLTYLSIAFVAVFLGIRLRSIARALLSMVPVLIATGAAALLAFGLGLELSPLTAVGGPLVVAACTEFTSLLLLRFIEERARGHSPRAAMDVTASRTGRAFLVSAATAVAGIAVMATSSMPLLRDFGLLVGLNVAVALIAALVVLPPVLVWADGPGGGWVSRGVVPRLQRAKEREARAQEAGQARGLARDPGVAPRQREGDEEPIAAR
jgi:uncharacterized protein